MPVTGQPTRVSVVTLEDIRGFLRDVAGQIPGTGVVNIMFDLPEFSDVDIQRAIREKLPKCVEQQERAGATFGATFVRRKGGGYIVVLTPEQFADAISLGVTITDRYGPALFCLERDGMTERANRVRAARDYAAWQRQVASAPPAPR